MPNFASSFNNAKNKVIRDQFFLATKKIVLVKYPSKRLEKILESEAGSALLSTCIGFAFSYLPSFKKKPYANVLSEELHNGSFRLLKLFKKSICS